MNKLLNTPQVNTACLILVCVTCIFSQTLYETDHQQYTILNRESNEATVKSLLHETEALLKETRPNLQQIIDMKDALNNSLMMINQAQKLFHRSPVVAFTALLSTNTKVQRGAVVKYDNVVTNCGGAYQPATGIFTAPYDGLYSFSCSLMTQPFNAAHVNMIKNGKIMSTLHSDNSQSTYPQSSLTLYLVLKKGDRVWMQNYKYKVPELHEYLGYNVFSGALIKDM